MLIATGFDGQPGDQGEKILRNYIQGDTIGAYATKHGAVGWGVIKNPASYRLLWNRRTDGRFHRISEGQAVDRENIHGARLVPNQKEDWIVVRDAHPALISRRLLEQAKQRRETQLTSIEQCGHNRRRTLDRLRIFCKTAVRGVLTFYNIGNSTGCSVIRGALSGY